MSVYIPRGGPQRLVARLAGDGSPLTAAEAAALVAAWMEPPKDIGEAPRSARPCRCGEHRWEFESGHCCCCGHDLEEMAA